MVVIVPFTAAFIAALQRGREEEPDAKNDRDEEQEDKEKRNA